MAEEKDNINAENSAAGKSGGRIFAGAEETDSKINLDEEIEKNIRIRTMPRKFQSGAGGGDKKTKVIGAIIMVVGLIVLSSAVYLAYKFLINPQAKTSVPAVKNPAAAESEKPAANNPAPIKEIPAFVEGTSTAPAVPETPISPIEIAPATSTPPLATSTVPVAASSTPPLATSTVPVAASSTPPLATSTVPVAASSTPPISNAPTGAKIVASLSNAEKVLFGADSSKEDSDGDGYGDLAETLSLYNPTGTGKILENQHVGAYQNTTNKYSVFYPKIWKLQNLENGDLLIFTAPDNSLIQIISQPNAGKESIKAWFSEQFPDVPVAEADIYSHDGWQGIFQQDKEIFYLADNGGNRIYTISYVPAANNDLSFYNIFLMMINSFTTK